MSFPSLIPLPFFLSSSHLGGVSPDPHSCSLRSPGSRRRRRRRKKERQRAHPCWAVEATHLTPHDRSGGGRSRSWTIQTTSSSTQLQFSSREGPRMQSTWLGARCSHWVSLILKKNPKNSLLQNHPSQKKK